MANIAVLLARILTTRYGKDMRQDLHDVIKDVNDDVETCGQAVSVSGNQLSLKRGSTTLSTATLPSGVSSVNNKTGAVTLTASDVGAAASSDIKNGTLTIQKNGTNVQTFSANQSTNATANITVPTKVSDLTNDSGFSAVSVNQIKSSGEKIAEITVDGTKTDIYASAGGGGGGGAVDSVNGMTGDVVLDVDDLNDTQISSLQSGQVLKYNGSKWVNANESGGGSNRNLLDNAWFTVNTSGFSSLSPLTANALLIDSWKSYKNSSGSIGWSSNVFTLTDDAVISQINTLEIGKTYTMSVNIGGTIDTHTFTYARGNFSGRFKATTDYNFGAVIGGGVFVQANVGKTITVNAVKLELGSVSTLNKDLPPNYNSELVKCNNPYPVIATEEYGSTSSKAYAIGDYFIRGGKLCKCTQAIASGGTFTKNTNYSEVDVGSQLSNALKTVNGSYSRNTTNVQETGTVLSIKQCGNVVNISGVLSVVLSVTSNPLAIALGTVSGITLPLSDIYSAPIYMSIGTYDFMQFCIKSNGQLWVTMNSQASGNASVYVNLTYIV